MKKLILSLVLLTLVALPLFVACQAEEMPELKLRFASPGPPPPNIMGSGYEYFENRVTELSGNTITFENFWSGSLLSANELLEGTQKRVADMSMGLPLFFPSQMPLATFDAYFPFCPSNPKLSADIKTEMYNSIPALTEDTEKNGIKQLLVYGTGSYDLQSNVPICTLEELKGKKIAAAGVSLPKWLEPVGAVPVSMPGAERYVSLQRGTIDGSLLPIISATGDKHYEVAKYLTYLDLGAPASMFFWINLDLWNSFTSKQKKIFEQAAAETRAWLFTEIEKQIGEGVTTHEQAGVTFCTISEADKAKWAQMIPDLPAEWAKEMEAQGLPGWEIVDTYIKLTKEAGHQWPREWGRR